MFLSFFWGKEAGLTETCHLSVYERSRHQNDKGKESSKNAFQCFLPWKACKKTLMEEQYTYTKNEYFDYFWASYVGKSPNAPKKTLQKTCIMGVFEVFRYKKPETHKYHCIWTNNEIKKNLYFECFPIIRYQNAKMRQKTPILETKRHYTERSLSRVFLSVLGTKTLKLWKSLYMKKKKKKT